MLEMNSRFLGQRWNKLVRVEENISQENFQRDASKKIVLQLPKCAKIVFFSSSGSILILC